MWEKLSKIRHGLAGAALLGLALISAQAISAQAISAQAISGQAISAQAISAQAISDEAIIGQARGGAMSFQIATTAFPADGMIPRKFTCDGPDASPELSWKDTPAGTQSFALIADDPDAPVGTWVHWVLYNVPASTSELPEGTDKKDELAGGALQGRNDFRKIGYAGPCPPPGKPHRYYFKLYALDTKLNLKAGATKAEVEQAMKGHILGQAQLMGRYGR
jgi:Raf kinase inhibitor-like YbhB/YbcL family protein